LWFLNALLPERALANMDGAFLKQSKLIEVVSFIRKVRSSGVKDEDIKEQLDRRFPEITKWYLGARGQVDAVLTGRDIDREFSRAEMRGLNETEALPVDGDVLPLIVYDGGGYSGSYTVKDCGFFLFNIEEQLK